MEYRKSYKGFSLFILGYTVGMLLFCFLLAENAALFTRAFMNFTTLAMVLLMLIIHKTESVYWINGVLFEDAREAGSKRRRAFARKYLVRFLWPAAGYLVYSVIAHALGWPFWIDLVLAGGGLIAAVLSTVSIRL